MGQSGIATYANKHRMLPLRITMRKSSIESLLFQLSGSTGYSGRVKYGYSDVINYFRIRVQIQTSGIKGSMA